MLLVILGSMLEAFTVQSVCLQIANLCLHY